ncbi:MAG: DUF4907 domain-containing protein [Chitinophagaceae bacterium]|nr:DUF4907 domain-containing protein [Chitinophagaceae bacterium]MCW5929775.1 DUF4907 domain-containing protein [Chitinophagaceae bacterium]
MKINRRSRVYILLVISLAVSFGTYIVTSYKKQNDELLRVTLNSFESGRGWGYEIFVDNKIFIRQETIPSLPGEKPFLTKENALKTGNAVMQKLLKGERPSLSFEEVTALGVVPGSSE